MPHLCFVKGEKQNIKHMLITIITIYWKCNNELCKSWWCVPWGNLRESAVVVECSVAWRMSHESWLRWFKHDCRSRSFRLTNQLFLKEKGWKSLQEPNQNIPGFVAMIYYPSPSRRRWVGIEKFVGVSKCEVRWALYNE